MGDLRDAFDLSVKENGLILAVDSGIVEAGRTIADQIDYARENLAGAELTKALYLMPHLVNITRELLATPAVRKSAGVEVKEAAGGKLGRLSSVPKPA